MLDIGKECTLIVKCYHVLMHYILVEHLDLYRWYCIHYNGNIGAGLKINMAEQ